MMVAKGYSSVVKPYVLPWLNTLPHRNAVVQSDQDLHCLLLNVLKNTQPTAQILIRLHRNAG
jgi:hypothetical protein